MKVVVHVSDAVGVRQAREQVAEFHRMDDEIGLMIVAEQEAVATIVRDPDPRTDRFVVLAENDLNEAGIALPSFLESTDNTYHLLARLQRKGWSYIRA